jgi:hypothetical protein
VWEQTRKERLMSVGNALVKTPPIPNQELEIKAVSSSARK